MRKDDCMQLMKGALSNYGKYEDQNFKFDEAI